MPIRNADGSDYSLDLRPKPKQVEPPPQPEEPVKTEPPPPKPEPPPPEPEIEVVNYSREVFSCQVAEVITSEDDLYDERQYFLWHREAVNLEGSVVKKEAGVLQLLSEHNLPAESLITLADKGVWVVKMMDVQGEGFLATCVPAT